jgi:hypothetical protein
MSDPVEWQPIGTAPKDGSPVIAYGEAFLTEAGYEVHSVTGPMVIYWEGIGWGPWRMIHGGRFKVRPTHWAPFTPPISTSEVMSDD